MSGQSKLRARAAMAVAAGVGAVLAAGVAPAAAGMITIDLASSASTVKTNDTFGVSVFGNSTAPIVAFGFHLVFNESVLAIDTATVEAPFKPLHAPNATLSDIAGYAFPDAPSGNDILLATVTFTARRSGVPQISIGVDPGNPTEGLVAVWPRRSGSQR
jgi:hypothetical protein